MTTELACLVYVDFDKDGSFATSGDDISAYWRSTRIKAGLQDADKRAASVGTCTIELYNDDRIFSPDNALSPYSGKMIPELPIQVLSTDGVTTWAAFRGVVNSWEPSSGSVHGDRMCKINCIDFMGSLQGADLSLPLQEDENASTILKKISAIAFDGSTATNSLTIDDHLLDSDGVSINGDVYLFRDSLTGEKNEVLIDSGSGQDQLQNAGANLVAAINAEGVEGTNYGTGTTAHQYVTADTTDSYGITSDNHDTWIALRDIAAGYDELSATYFLANGALVNDKLRIFMRKTGSPTGTLTITMETSAGFSPSGTLVDAAATTTVSESSLSATGGWVDIDWGSDITIEIFRRIHIHIVTDRAASGTDYVELGADSGDTTLFDIREKTGATWGDVAGDPIVLFPAAVSLSANARGAWGNALTLAKGSLHSDADSRTLNTGTEAGGSLADTRLQNGVYYNIAEVTGSPGFDIEFTFTVAGTAQAVYLFGRYQGNIAHTVNVDAYNGATWDNLGTLAHSTSDALHSWSLLATHTIAGEVKMRFYHVSSGNVNHDLYLDHLYVLSNESLPGTGDGITITAATFSGGTDEPSGFQSFDAGDLIFPLAADEWSNTNGLKASEDVAKSERGLYFAARDGTLTYHPYTWFFANLPTVAAIDVTNTMDKINPRVALRDIYNEVVVEYIPRRRAATGVIARANGPIKVDARTKRTRRNPTSAPGTTTQKIKYIEGETGNVVGATDIEQPVKTTDYTVRTGEQASGEFDDTSKTVTSSRDVTDKDKISVTLAKNSGDIEATFSNSARRELYVHGFQVRGTGLIAYDKQEIIRRDETSVTTYGKRSLRIRLPFPSDRRFAESVAEYELNQSKDPRTLVKTVEFQGTRTLGSTHLYSVEIGDVVTLTDQQTGIADQRYMVYGWSSNLSVSGDHSLSWIVRRLDDFATWILGDATYSVLDTSTILAL
jgi:hypothetical protein